MKHLAKRWFFCLALLLFLFPLYGRLADRSRWVLKGVTEEAETPAVTLETVLDGSCQSDLDTWWREHLPGRSFLVRLRSQVLYSVFRTSSNTNVLLGKNGNLYEDFYINFQTGVTPPLSETEIAAMVAGLTRLRELLAENGKHLYLFITPSKARFFPDDYPWYYDAMNTHPSPDNYALLVDALRDGGIPFFDGVAFLQQNEGLYEAPYFYKAGTHWDHVWGTAAAAGLLRQIRSDGVCQPAEWEVGETLVTDRVLPPNSDLYDLLNLLPRADFPNYAPVLTQKTDGDALNVLYRGGSFLDESLLTLSQNGVFGHSAYLSNANCVVYDGADAVSSQVFETYDELDLAAMLADTDLVILEVNEGSIPSLGWGFVEYLLEHPRLLGGA